VTEALFVSDLHLDPARPRATATFIDFLRGTALRAERLYVLGDLFEFWIGDDDDDELARRVTAALAEYTTSGRQCLVMRGNRDFLLGEAFAARTGAGLLDDPAVAELFGERVLLMHGDLLCSDDHRYQRYRRIVNHPRLQRAFLALPRSWRRAAGNEGRRRSRRYTAANTPKIMDVNDGAVGTALAVNDARILVHGHTHRPGIHRLQVGGSTATRIVLGDWYEQGSVLSWSNDGYRLLQLPFA
jgi:UDP-2,3-diacylglucosamine hydrolase